MRIRTLLSRGRATQDQRQHPPYDDVSAAYATLRNTDLVLADQWTERPLLLDNGTPADAFRLQSSLRHLMSGPPVHLQRNSRTVRVRLLVGQIRWDDTGELTGPVWIEGGPLEATYAALVDLCHADCSHEHCRDVIRSADPASGLSGSPEWFAHLRSLGR